LRALAAAAPEVRAAVEERARSMSPAPAEPLPPMARALAVTGCELASSAERRPFVRLRARVRRELAEG
jgi:hypothetical protein